MKRLILFLTMVGVGALAAMATAGDYHTGGSLVCTDCHIMHASQHHNYADAVPDSANTRLDLSGGTGNVPAAPIGRLLRAPVNNLCLSCHDNKAFAPDVFGVDNQVGYASTRMAGGLNRASNANGGLLPDPGTGYNQYTGHSLGFTGAIPGDSALTAQNGMTSWATDGLECTSCHAQHGGTTYRNLLNRGIFKATITYNVSASPVAAGDTMTVVERTNTGAQHYAYPNVDYYEQSQTTSPYADWCRSCHVVFHGASGGANVGGNSGGWVNITGGSEWLRHPNADVNIGAKGSTFVSDLKQYNSTTRDAAHRVKVMDANALWTGAASPADSTITPSCFSCHKAHGNQNAFGLIFMPATGTVTDNGVNGGVYKDLCKNCHTEG